MTNNTNELYIVTGAAGNLGSAIVRELVSRKKPVRAFVLRGEEAARHLPKEAQVIEGDVTDISTLETLFAGIPDNTAVYCIHCAAMVSVSNLVAEKIWHVNVDGTQYIIDKCRDTAYASSSSAPPVPFPSSPWAQQLRRLTAMTPVQLSACTIRPRRPPANWCLMRYITVRATAA